MSTGGTTCTGVMTIGTTACTPGSAGDLVAAASSIFRGAPAGGSSESSEPGSGAAGSTRIPVSGPPRLTSSSTRVRAAVPAISSEDSSAAASATASTVSTARPSRRVTLRATIAIASR